MKLPLTLALVLACTGISQAVIIDFDNSATFAAEFPTTSSSGDASSVSLGTSPDRVILYAQETVASSASQVSIYTAAGFSGSLNFVSAPKEITFDSPALSFSAGGSTYIGNFGVVNSAGGPMQQNSGPDYGVFFRINRNQTALELVTKITDTTTVISSWAATGAGGVGYAYDTVSITLTGTAWSVTGIATNSQAFSGSGTFSTAFTTENWGSDFYIGLQANQTGTNAGRYADLTMESITIVPEPDALALLIFGTLILFTCARRRTSRIVA